MPFGGLEASGYCRFGGRWGLDAFTDTRWIIIEDPHRHYAF
jgi:vanillin dehydrogenase